ncbi:MAG TPA: Rieske 2Fe-2S domain-containing protein [Bryobacteraceae bacterium]|nr:Rieske 2Fe-2S domain-containing protein [Bryobacteraceae bacterium]
MPWTKLADASELAPGTLMEVDRDGLQYALCNVGGEVRALAGVCPHQGGPLGEGALNDGVITCPWHMWEFDSRSGECVFNRALTIPVYPVRVEGGEVLVDIA